MPPLPLSGSPFRCAGILAVLLYSFVTSPAQGQAGGFAPGDSLRFQASRVVRWQVTGGGGGHTTTVERTTVTGTLISVGSDSLIVSASGRERAYALDAVEDVRVWGEYEAPVARGFRRGAIVGGVVGGSLGLALGLCNPAIFGDEGCMGPDDAATIVYPTLIVGLGGAVAFGLLGALLAPKGGWERVEITSASFVPGEGGTFALRIAVAP